MGNKESKDESLTLPIEEQSEEESDREEPLTLPIEEGIVVITNPFESTICRQRGVNGRLKRLWMCDLCDPEQELYVRGLKLLESTKEKEREEGLKIIETSAERCEACGMLALGLFYEYGLKGKVKNIKKARELYEKVEKLGISEGTERLKLLNVQKNDINPRNKDIWEALIKRIEHNSMVFTLDLSCSVVHILEQTAMKKRKRKKK